MKHPDQSPDSPPPPPHVLLRALLIKAQDNLALAQKAHAYSQLGWLHDDNKLRAQELYEIASSESFQLLAEYSKIIKDNPGESLFWGTKGTTKGEVLTLRNKCEKMLNKAQTKNAKTWAQILENNRARAVRKEAVA